MTVSDESRAAFKSSLKLLGWVPLYAMFAVVTTVVSLAWQSYGSSYYLRAFLLIVSIAALVKGLLVLRGGATTPN
jgi:hypothetical protein